MDNSNGQQIVKLIQFTTLTDWLQLILQSPTFEDELSKRFQFDEQDRPQPGSSTCCLK